jgi:hypothetical protein
MTPLTLTQTAEIAEFSRVFAEERFGVAVKVRVRPAIDRATIIRRCVIGTVIFGCGGLYSISLVTLMINWL